VSARTLKYGTLLGLLVVAQALGCGGTGSYSGSVFRGDTTYHLDPPSAGYRRVDVEGANDLAWANESNGTVIQVNGSCSAGLDIPLVALTNHLLIGFTAREYVGDPELRPLSGREALFTHVRARFEGVPREMLLVVTKKNACVYDFALIAAPGAAFERARPDFERMVASFDAGTSR
jgi:hypothetical protein